jgi:osmotically-inducible protein OsmY
MQFVNRSMAPLRLALAVVLSAALAGTFSGCALIAAGAVVGGTYAATDRRTLGAQADDPLIAARGADQIDKALGDAAHVDVNAFNHKVLLTGEVADEAAKARAEQIVKNLETVTAVVNELIIAAPSSVAARSSDVLLTTRVKAQLVNDHDIFANAFKVVTEHGTVYLMGRVTEHEGDYAATVARSTSGVMAVVKVYDYISDDDLHRMATQAAPSSS